ncbi:NAD-dependent succinate-semialdehyde dehydrogenase [Bacillus benzoevorans]|uniref:Aldehyde dehydrogenase n=1 Tax=Bacillus benzoevorans TaxID=1456 RepID=A0A7X0HXD1_9BACI|nr:NAD-dependent succinate-semialdehyde dehydrogenase [Bacillus benzoevorans]MBB6447722.1 succinate-semialdehyde dehydrogenase/glutarate-semialdehyde dehydrogenase [Bacillus benzoevorans]
MKHWPMIINGKEVDAHDRIEVNNPATLEIIATIPNGGAEEAKHAVDAAARAFKIWAKKTAAERSQLLMNWFHLIDKHKEEIAEIMTTEQGKPLPEALGEVVYANSFISWYAEEGKRIYGETIPASLPNKRLFVQKQPIGVIAAITPWNFPAAMITRKVAPAIAAGCTAVIKPSELTPLTAIRLVQLANEAGIPDGVLNIVTGDAAQIGEAWMADSRIRKVSFTGSTRVGKLLMRQAADSVKKVSLELGGHAPFIITANADLADAAKGLIVSKYRNAGQTCVCANRIFVHESVEKPFIEIYKAEVAKLKTGNGLVKGNDVGPLIKEAALKKVQDQLDDAVKKGAQLVLGGNGLNEENGYFITPAILTNVTEDMKCMNEETFGPITPITTYRTTDEVIERANNTPFGLAAYIFTTDIAEAIALAEGVEYGIVGLNDGLPSTAQAPFGGFKESGLGREGGHYGIEEYLEIKYISLAF